MHDVKLQRHGDELRDAIRRAEPAVEPLSMLGCVEALPFEPEMVLEIAAVECPCETRFVGTFDTRAFRAGAAAATHEDRCDRARWELARWRRQRARTRTTNAVLARSATTPASRARTRRQNRTADCQIRQQTRVTRSFSADLRRHTNSRAENASPLRGTTLRNSVLSP